MFQVVLKFLKLGIVLIRVKISKNIDEKMSLKLIDSVFGCGAVTIKFAQWYATRYDMNSSEPQHLCKILQKTFENCPEHKFSYTEKIFRKNFNKEIDKVLNLKRIPIASGSVGQVYEGTMIETGQSIVMKVKHPNLMRDYKITVFFLKFFGLFMRMKFNVDDFLKDVKEQFDYEIEAQNIENMYGLYKDDELIVTPKLLMSSSDIIIMTKEDGKSFSSIKSDIQKHKIALGISSFQRQNACYHGVCHGDLHLGNWKVREEDNGFKLVIYDFGLVNHADPIDMQKWFKAYQFAEFDEIIRIAMKNSNKPVDEKILKYIAKCCEEVLETQHSMHNLMKVILPMLRKYKIYIKEEFISNVIAFSLTEQVIKNASVESTTDPLRNYVNRCLDIIAFCETKNTCIPLKNMLQKDIDDYNYTYNEKVDDIGLDLDDFYSNNKLPY